MFVELLVMVDLQAVVTLGIICVFGVISPGPSFFAISHRAVNQNRVDAFVFSLGIVLVNMIWAMSALFGVNLLFLAFPWLFWVVKISGGSYLMFLGYKIIKNLKQNQVNKNSKTSKKIKFLHFKDGMLTNFANPKSMIFYASIFSTAIPSSASNNTLIAMLIMVGIISLLWYGATAIFFSYKIIANYYANLKKIYRNCLWDVFNSFWN
jgi:threonine efflux protein